MKEGLRFVDSDMHVQEPGDLLEKYLDPEFRNRVTWAVDGPGKISRRTWTIDGLPAGKDSELQQYRKKAASSRASGPVVGAATGVLSASRIADSGRMDFAIERGYDEEAQIMGMEMEGIDIAVLFPTSSSETSPGRRPRPSSWAAPACTTSRRKTSGRRTRAQPQASSDRPRDSRRVASEGWQAPWQFNWLLYSLIFPVPAVVSR